jgi:hypothetical protein
VLEQADPDVGAWWGLLTMMRRRLPHYWTAADVVSMIEVSGISADELPTELGEPDRPGFLASVGYALRQKRMALWPLPHPAGRGRETWPGTGSRSPALSRPRMCHGAES